MIRTFRLIASFGFAVCLFAVGFSQTYTPKDTTALCKKNYMRQWSYENHQSSFPAPKKSNWSFGVKGGMAFVSGDVRATPGWGAGLNLRRACGHVLSFRLSADASQTYGQNLRRQGGFLNNTALNGVQDAASNYFANSYAYVYHNFQSTNLTASLEAVVTINNLNFYNRTPKVLLYVFGGPAAFAYNTKINALNANGMMYNYSGINPTDGANGSDRRDAATKLNDLKDDTYETKAETYPGKAKMGAFSVIPAISLGAGLNFRMSRRMDFAVEYRIIPTFDDLVDGQRWQENNSQSASTDFHQFASVGFNFRIGKGEDSKWFTNPMEGPLNRIRTLEAAAAKEDKDSDADGVVDARDKEPNTPSGVKVDVRGAAMDSDEDGVPDFKDSEPFSPKGSQVDRSGKSLDSDSDGIPDIFDKEINSRPGAQVDARGVEIKLPKPEAETAANKADLDLMMPLIYFDLGKSVVKAEFYPELYNVARIMKANPELRIRVSGNADNRSTNAFNMNLSKERADNVVAFMEKNFSLPASRFQVEHKGADNTIISGLPQNKDPRFEELHHLNRRVEMHIIK